ncbi:hypothetical protein F5Y19DRAFT_471489 [Xylariaceae sp. FL1651]|nr:hypothetical protein F5Y19DRAFT_471489 [Xylariaceae sp. FL1651]
MLIADSVTRVANAVAAVIANVTPIEDAGAIATDLARSAADSALHAANIRCAVAEGLICVYGTDVFVPRNNQSRRWMENRIIEYYDRAAVGYRAAAVIAAAVIAAAAHTTATLLLILWLMLPQQVLLPPHLFLKTI